MKRLLLFLVLVYSTSCTQKDLAGSIWSPSEDPPEVVFDFTFPAVNVLEKGTVATAMSPATTDSVNSYVVTPSLPAGLALNSTTGEISGTPTETLAKTTFTITGSIGSVEVSKTFDLQVNITFDVLGLGDSVDSNAGDEICSDGASCTLRAAIDEANALPGVKSTINIPSGTITLAAAGLTTPESVTIIGAGAGSTIIDANDGTPIVNIFKFSGGASQEVNVSGVTLQNAVPMGFTDSGGAIQSTSGNFNLSDCEILNNTTTANFIKGAGVYIAGANSVIDNCLFDGNSTTLGEGGAINAFGATGNLTVKNSTFNNNTGTGASGGGAIFVYSMNLVVENSIFTNNTGQSGGAIYGSSNYIQVTNSTFTGNTRDNSAYGAAVFSYQGSIDIENSTFSENLYEDVRIRYSLGPSTINNTTFYNSTGVAGLIHDYSQSTLDLTNVTIVTNGSYAIQSVGDASKFTTVNMKNTIIDTSGGANTCYTGAWSSIVSLGNNIVSTNDCSAVLTEITDLNNTDPLVVAGAPAENGGPTKTIALQAGSPAIDRIDPSDCDLATDQRELPRPIDNGGGLKCDSGAVEMP